MSWVKGELALTGRSGVGRCHVQTVRRMAGSVLAAGRRGGSAAYSHVEGSRDAELDLSGADVSDGDDHIRPDGDGLAEFTGEDEHGECW